MRAGAASQVPSVPTYALSFLPSHRSLCSQMFFFSSLCPYAFEKNQKTKKPKKYNKVSCHPPTIGWRVPSPWSRHTTACYACHARARTQARTHIIPDACFISYRNLRNVLSPVFLPPPTKPTSTSTSTSRRPKQSPGSCSWALVVTTAPL